ncbi:LytR family transcriptional regulator, partial [Bacillus cereus]
MYNYRRRYVVLRTRYYLRITTVSPLKINVVNYFPTNELRRLYMEE